MDGFAVVGSDIPASEYEVRELRCLGTSWAGKPLDVVVQPGECVRIMTGAKMPDGADTVVIQEHAEDKGDSVRIGDGTDIGRNVRQAGEDVRAGGLVLPAGTLMRPAEVGLTASLGVAEVAVKPRLRVAYFATGDELRTLEDHAGQPLDPGELFDSNRHSLFGMLTRLGVEVIDLGVVGDTAEATRAALREAAEKADVVLTSGGVSAGEKDFVTDSLEEEGEVTFWKLAMRPGRPLACGRIGAARFFGLPGNPVAVMVTFYEFVQPALKRLMGMSELHTPRLRVRCVDKLRKSQGRIEYQRGILYRDESGETVVKSTGKQGAGRLSSMVAANCLIVIAAELQSVEPGDWVEVQVFEGLV
jgi:molybdopterin molybdotransferase